MHKEDKTLVAIVLGSLIIGGFIYAAILNKSILIKDNVPVIVDSPLKSSAEQIGQCQANDDTIVTKVIDGDTVIVKGGYHIRLLGIDADEKGYPCYEPAKIRLEELVLNKQVKLEKDKTDIDKYKRCLRTIFIDNPSVNSGRVQNVDLELIKEGLAVARFYEPDVKYRNEIVVWEKYAIENKVGCKWGNIK